MTDGKVRKLLLSECDEAVIKNKEKMLSACGVKQKEGGGGRYTTVISVVFIAALLAAVVIACCAPLLFRQNAATPSGVTDTEQAGTEGAADTTAEETDTADATDKEVQPDEPDRFGDVKFIDGRQTRKIEEREMTVSRLKYTVSAEYAGAADELYEKYGVKLYVSYDNPDNPLTIIVQDGKRTERCYSELLNGTPLCFVWADKTPLGSPALLYVCTEPYAVAEDETSDHTTEYPCHSTLFAYYPDTGTFAAEMPLGQYRRDFNNYGESEFYEIPLYNALLTDESQVRLDEQTGLLYLDLIDRSYDYGPEPQTIYMINYYDDTDGVRRINCHGLMSPLYFLLDINGTYNIVYPNEMHDLSKTYLSYHSFYDGPRSIDYFNKFKKMRYDYGGDFRLLYDCSQVSELTLSLYAAKTGKAFTDSTEIDTNGKTSCEDMTELIKETLKKYPIGDYKFNLRFTLKNGQVLNYPVILRQREPGEDVITDISGEEITVSSGGEKINVSASSSEWIALVNHYEFEYKYITYDSDFNIILPDGYTLTEISLGNSAISPDYKGTSVQAAKIAISGSAPSMYYMSVTAITKIEGITAALTYKFCVIKENAEETKPPEEYLTVRSGENEIKVQGATPPYPYSENLADPLKISIEYDGAPEYSYSDELEFNFAYLILILGDTFEEYHYNSVNELNKAIEDQESGTLAVIINTSHKSGGYNAVFRFSIEK